jgi:hypothetical protein
MIVIKVGRHYWTGCPDHDRCHPRGFEERDRQMRARAETPRKPLEPFQELGLAMVRAERLRRARLLRSHRGWGRAI